AAVLLPSPLWGEGSGVRGDDSPLSPLGRGVGGEGQDPAKPALSDEIKELVRGNNEFAFDLYRELAAKEQGKNIVFSPFSISTALAMPYAGARGKTAEEMARVMHFTLGQERVPGAGSSCIGRNNDC